MIKSFLDIYKNFSISKEEALSEIYFVLDIEFGMQKKDFLLGKTLSEKSYDKAKEIFETRIKTGMPIQYVIGKTYFMNDIFQVNENTLIPRDDTQILVNNAIDIIKQRNYKTILDIGTGSGIIAIELAKYCNVNVTACDISAKAIEMADKNAKQYNTNINFIKSDIYENIKQKYDMIISNPPYISFSQKSKLQSELSFEPANALFAEDNGLYFYKQIIQKAKHYLNNNGCIIFEIGINQSQNIQELLEKQFSDIKIKKDVSQIERVIYGYLKS